ncbi:MAG: dihydroneopterin aldolase [Ignavibacteria bacterium]|nr:dihydroneopterin aldolase [Ignavibacteria bacterium]
MTTIIRIKRISFYAYHGVFREEQNIGGKFEADIDIHTDFSGVADNDSLLKTVDYEKVYRTIMDISEGRKYHLIETLAVHITDELFRKFDHISKIYLRIRKNNPPIGGVVDSVEVEVQKSRDEYKSGASVSL